MSNWPHKPIDNITSDCIKRLHLLLNCFDKFHFKSYLIISVRSRFGSRALQNPLGYSSFGYETANDADVETMEEDVRAVTLNEHREQNKPQQQQGGGGAIGKFKKKDKKKKTKKQFWN